MQTVSRNPETQAAYEAMRARGESHALAEMLALGSPPMSNTDREFLQGRCNGNQFEGQPHVGDRLARMARAAGVDPKGKVYVGGLADYPGDPRAWVDGRGDVKRICEERGWGCEGSVSTPLTRIAEPLGGGLASDIVNAKVAERMDAEPGMRVEDVREKVIQQHAPHWAKKEVANVL